MTATVFALSAALLLAVEAPMSERLAGDWSGQGVWMGKPATARATWRSVLGGRFLRLEYRVTPVGATAPSFEGEASWALPDGATGIWLDSQGSVHPLALEILPNAVTATWPAVEPRGRTHYRWSAPGKIVIVDEIRAKDGAWRTFAEMTYQKQ